MRPEAASPLTSAEPVVGVNGLSYRVTPGVLDDAARELFQNGQCLAFAIEVAVALGEDRVSLRFFDDGEEWRLLHAYAVAADGTLIDSEGSHAPADIERWLDGDYPDRHVAEMTTVADARTFACSTPGLQEPRFDLARSVAHLAVPAHLIPVGAHD